MNNTFQQYLNFCSFSYQKIKDAEFEANFHNHVVKWKGRVKNIGPAELDIILDHAKTLEDSPDMMLRLLQKRIQKSSDKIQVGGDLTFRAQLISYPNAPGKVIEGMLAKKDMPKSEDLTITYPEFSGKFGLETNSETIFEKNWKSKSVKVTAKVDSITEPAADAENAADISLTSVDKPKITTSIDAAPIIAANPDPIKLYLPKGMAEHLAEFKTAQTSNQPITFVATILSRGAAHEMKFVSIPAPDSPGRFLHKRTASSPNPSSTTTLPTTTTTTTTTTSPTPRQNSQSPGLSWLQQRRAMSPNPYGRSGSSTSPGAAKGSTPPAAGGGGTGSGTGGISPGAHRSTTPTPSRPMSVGRMRMLQAMEEERKREEQARADAERRLAMVNRIRRSTSPAPPSMSGGGSGGSGSSGGSGVTGTSPRPSWKDALKKTSPAPPASGTPPASSTSPAKDSEGVSFAQLRNKFAH